MNKRWKRHFPSLFVAEWTKTCTTALLVAPSDNSTFQTARPVIDMRKGEIYDAKDNSFMLLWHLFGSHLLKPVDRPRKVSQGYARRSPRSSLPIVRRPTVKTAVEESNEPSRLQHASFCLELLMNHCLRRIKPLKFIASRKRSIFTTNSAVNEFQRRHTWGRRWIIFILSSEKYVLIDSKSETAQDHRTFARKKIHRMWLNITSAHKFSQSRRRNDFETELNWFALAVRMDFSISTRGSH